MRKEEQPPVKADESEVERDLDFCKNQGWNLIRLPYFWEAILNNEDNFFEELDHIFKNCKSRGIKVFPSFFHWYGSSAWRPDYGGFPASVVQDYAYLDGIDYEKQSDVKRFWDDLFAGNVYGNPGLWKDMASVIRQVIDAAKPYINWIYGFEILNEPHIWQNANYAGLGNMHTAIAKDIRKATWKAVIFARETTHGGYKRSPKLEPLIAPRANRLIYDPHIYQTDSLDIQVKNWKTYLDLWELQGLNVRLVVGEFADQQVPNAPTPANTEKYVKTWAAEGWDATYWAYNLNTPDPANRLATSANKLTQVGTWYVDAIRKYYKTA